MGEKSSLLILSALLLTIFSILSFYSDFVGNMFIYIMKYFTFALFMLSTFLSVRHRLKGTKYNHLIFMFLLFFGSFLNLMNSNGKGLISSTLYIVVALGIAFSTIFFFRKLSEEEYLKILWVFFGVIFIFVICTSLFQSFTSAGYYVQAGRLRFNGLFHNSNELARFALLGIFISLRILNIYKNKFIKFILLVMIVSSFYVIHISDSRAALLIGLSAVLLYMLSSLYLKMNKLFFTCIILLCISLLVAFGVPFAVDYLNNANLDSLNELSSGRIDNWVRVLDTSNLLALLFGSGAVREGLAATAIITNGYIELIQYFGLLGLFVWLIFIFIMFLKKIRSSLKEPSLSTLQGIGIIFLFLIYYLLEGGMVSIGNIVSIYFWVELAQRHPFKYISEKQNIKGNESIESRDERLENIT